MPEDRVAPKPKAFGLCTRIVYVHQAISLAFFAGSLRSVPLDGVDKIALAHLIGIATSVLLVVAMFGFANRKSSSALLWLRLILWIAVAKIAAVQSWLMAHAAGAWEAHLRVLLINELIMIPLALYWSRPVHTRYIASFASATRHGKLNA
ncbi:MAG: hypothetical protein RLZZ106_188 [Cyanobacteriota bacterium]|jgi:hypothetical protein